MQKHSENEQILEFTNKLTECLVKLVRKEFIRLIFPVQYHLLVHVFLRYCEIILHLLNY